MACCFHNFSIGGITPKVPQVKKKFLGIPLIEGDTVFLICSKGYEIRVFSVIFASKNRSFFDP